MKEICDHRKTNRAISIADGFTTARNGTRVPKRTTVGWDLLVEWKDGTTDWVPLKDMKESNPIETMLHHEEYNQTMGGSGCLMRCSGAIR